MTPDDPTVIGPTPDDPAGWPKPEPDADGPLERVGDQIGPYRLLELIGEGGFGSVWLAERREPFVQRVALKLIKAGQDTKQVLARFEQERQALAVMDHPGIAKVLDGGATPAGRPYFAMEFVKGRPITEFCDRQKLGIEDRLKLFEQACEAIQHAHLKGIVHRDITPRNILAFQLEGEEPKLKVIDFGLAKVMGPRQGDPPLHTGLNRAVGTPAYMSPEQANPGSSDIDTRSDIYSLGVLLYELLAGVTPVDVREVNLEVLRELAERDPPAPSVRLSGIMSSDRVLASRIEASRGVKSQDLVRRLRGELEWIPLKAMRKERQHRYQTALEFANDVRAYLDGRPLLAGPESTAYRLRKYVRRNRALVAGAGAVLMALVVGLGLATWQWQAANRARDEAIAAKDAEKERADQLKKVSDFQSQMLSQIDTTQAGIDLMADVRQRFEAALEKAGVAEADRTTRLDALRQELVRVNATDAAAAMIDRTILKPAIKTIDTQFKDDPATDASLRQALADQYHSIGIYDAAYPLQESALASRRRILGEEHPDTITSISNMGVLLDRQGKLAEAEPYLSEALEKRRRVLGEEHPDTLISIINMGLLLQAQGKLAEAEPICRDALEKRRRVLGEEHPDTLISINNMGLLLHAQGKFAEAEPYYRDALEKSRRVLGEEHPDTLISINNMGGLLDSQGKLAEAEPYLRDALEKSRRVLGEEHPDTITSIISMGFLLDSQGKFAEAEPYYRDALEKSRRVLGEEHPDTLISIINMGGLLWDQGKFAEAEPYYRDALEKSRRVLGEEHPYTLTSINNMGQLLKDQGKFAEAEPYLRDALEKRRRVLGEEHPDTITSIINMGGLLDSQGKFAEAEPYYRDALEKSRRVLGEEHPDTLISIINMGGLLWDQGKFAEAEPYYRDALEKSRRVLGEEHADTLKSLQSLIDLYTAWDKAEPGKDYAAKAAEWKAALDAVKPPEATTPATGQK
jgi:serine/threonine protein kinase